MKKRMIALAVAGLVLILASFGELGDAQETTVRIDPPQTNLGETGDESSADVVVEDVANLAGFQFSLEFDSSVLEATGVEEGPFLAGSGREVVCRDGEIVAGSADLVCVTLGAPVSLGGDPGAEGSGILATVAFTATGKGETSLSLQDVTLVEAEIDEAEAPIVIPVATEDGKVTVAAGDGFAWVLWGPIIGLAAVVIAVAGVAGWRRLTREP